MKITTRMLRHKGACPGQVDIFKAEWPNGMDVTRESCIRAVELGLDINWASNTLLPPSLWGEYLSKEQLLKYEYRDKCWLIMDKDGVTEYGAEEQTLHNEYMIGIAILFAEIAAKV